MKSFDGRLYEPIYVYPDLKKISFLKTISKVKFALIKFDESNKLCWKRQIPLSQ